MTLLASPIRQMGFVADSISPATLKASAARRRMLRATSRIAISNTATINTTTPPITKPRFHHIARLVGRPVGFARADGLILHVKLVDHIHQRPRLLDVSP